MSEFPVRDIYMLRFVLAYFWLMMISGERYLSLKGSGLFWVNIIPEVSSRLSDCDGNELLL